MILPFHIMFRTLARVLQILAVWSLLTGTATAQTATAPIAAYLAAQDSVFLPDGRRINFVCSGAGSPVVILTAGLNDWSVAWRRVQPGVATTTRVCSWDRAGFGFSDPRRDSLDIARSARDLDLALKAAKITGPFIVVGHSMGGLETLLFADARQSDIVGILLVDPTIPGQYQRFERVAPHFTKFARAGRALGGKAARQCAKYLKKHGLELAARPACPPPIPPVYPTEVVAALTPLQANADRVLTQSSLVTTMERSTKLGLDRRRNYRDVPLIVLSAPADDKTVADGIPTAFSFPPDVDPRILEEVPRMAAEIAQGHVEISGISTRGTVRQILGVGHYIPLIRPEVVVEAISELIEIKRARESR